MQKTEYEEKASLYEKEPSSWRKALVSLEDLISS
jgi:hypothetical protein